MSNAAYSGLLEPNSGNGAVLTAAVKHEPDGLDPSLYTEPTFMVTSQIYETLVKASLGDVPEKPSLAESWSGSADGLTWTFNIRPGVQFHDGTNLDAGAVVFNLERWWDPAHPYHNGDFFFAESLLGGFKGDPNSLITAIAATGSGQVQFQLSRPSSDLPSRLTAPALSIASPAAIQAGTLVTMPVGSGPFQFVSWTPGDQVELVAYTNYWGEKPILDDLVFDIIADDDDRFAALQSEVVHSVGDLPIEFASGAASDGDLSVLWYPPVNTGYLGINRAHPPLDNPLVRQAISHAVNKVALIEQYFAPGNLPADQFLPHGIWGRDPDLVDYAYDPSLASALLDQAGLPNGFTTTLAIRDVWRIYLPEPIDTASAIRQDLLAVGIDAEVIVYDSGEFIDKVNAGELDLFLLGWGADYPHPVNFFDFHFCFGYVAFGPKDEALCDELQAARAENDFAERLATYQWASGRVLETIPLVPISYGRDLFVTRTTVFPPEFTPFALNTALYRRSTFISPQDYLPLVVATD